MKRALLLVLLVVGSFSATLPESYLEGLLTYLQQQSPWTINGKFYQYDFDGDGNYNQPDNWLYLAIGEREEAYQLLGTEPTPDNPFGWRPLPSIPADLDISNPQGYFIFIDYPRDQELFGSPAFSWLYLSREGKMVFKLMGAREDHTFEYLDTNGDGSPDPLPNLTPLLQGERVTFQKSYTGSALNPP
ncbi:MAG: hypothetical protein GXO19_07120, partial [Epsilonproteobacteria bacterium]|nr:hypothetical protein [Campylobacterota bacterium]NPA57485.1 hypothetical protein [Campylobacterota bacterium]